MDEKVLKALGEPKRFQLLQLMAKRGYCVQALAKQSQLSEPAVSQHLKVLREAGLVYGVKRGYYTHYSLDKDTVGNVIAALEQLRSLQRKPCDGPFYGCPESEYIRCGSYVPPEERKKEEKESC